MRAATSRVLLVLLLTMNACGDSSQPGENVHVTAVKVSPLVVQLTAIGETRQLTVAIAPLNATDQAVTWESSDLTVVTVDATGLVTARAAGSGVFVTAISHDGHHESSANVSVIP